ncbi:MAG: ATP-binding protein [Bacteroidaceae bacterium]|nr:ATP-binding protein [Bacteroidaceae bacterium]
MAIDNPFIVGRYLAPEYFCDREEETDFLRKQMRNGRNVALISPRRLGKTGLIHHFFHQADVREQFYTFFIDIYATSSLTELVYLLGKAIFEQLKPRSTAWRERFLQVVSSLRVGFKLDAVTGNPTFDIGLGDIQSPETTLSEIFRYLEEADRPCIVAIDEFQQVASYAEQNTEALLRTHIQKCSQTLFIFSGSKRHLMTQMFNSPAKPFYQSAIGMTLQPLDRAVYADFARRLFALNGRRLANGVAEEVYDYTEGYTWFMQMLMNELYALTPIGGTCTPEYISNARSNILQAQDGLYRELLANLSIKQRQLLQAIAREGRVAGITSSAFIRSHHLPSASSVQSAARPLLENDIITQTDGTYRLYDFFLSQWLVSMY